MAEQTIDTRRMTVDEWRAKAMELGNGDFLNTPFKCPLCGNVATPQQFKEAGADNADRAATNCIGRYVGAKGGLNSGTPVPQPCDWAAYGLFGTLGKGIVVVLEDGKTMDVFPFADGATT